MLASFLIVSGCAKTGNNPNQSEIAIWHWMSDRVNELDTLASQYFDLTGIKVKFELYAPTSAYTSKIRSAAQADKLPDIYGILLEMRDFASFINAGHVYDITGYMDENDGQWRKIFYESALSMNYFSPNNQYKVKSGIYGVPIDVNNIQLIYNIDLLKKAGWDTSKLPSTWDEFMHLAGLLKKAGIKGLVSGWGEIWMIACFADNFAWNIMGKEKIIETIKGNVPYTDPAWVRVFELFYEMKQKGMLFPGSVTMVNKEAEQIFAIGRAAVAFNGSWGINVYSNMNPDLNYKASLPPKVNLNRHMYIWGGTTSFVVNNASELREESVKFLKWLTEEKQQTYLSQRTDNIPANKLSAASLKGPIAEFADDIDNVVHPRFLPVEEYPLVTEAFNKGIQSIMIGEATPQEVAERVQARKLKEMKKAERFKAYTSK